MTFESYANRLTKHLNQLLNKVKSVPASCGTIDLTPRVPRLSWLSSKTFRQGNGGRKNQSGHLQEHEAANTDNANPYQAADGKWYWFDETERSSEVGYETRAAANIALLDYVKWLNTPKEIGGICEDLDIPGDNANPISN